MIKTGIYTLEEARDPAAQRGFFGGIRKISITLYADACRVADDEKTAERILFQFADGRNVFKRTYARRFPEFDQAAARIIRENFATDALSVHDAAVSDGRTAVDFHGTLSPLFSHLSYVASDYNPSLKIVRQGKTAVTFGEDGQVLEICRPPFVFNKVKESVLYYPLNAVARAGLKVMAASSVKAYRQGKIKGEKVMLFSPQALKLAQKDPRFTLAQHDILTPFPDRYDVIRAMNILDPAYFADDELRVAGAHVHKGLKEGGLFIAGSNHNPDSPVNGTVYRRTATGFEEVWRSGEGTPAHGSLQR